ncbi:MAG: F0F1 ATP synthase subunit B [Microscillaceae bacterium]|jgi:F-type H+-transporting ATPase subunit b|nr:F0F1 ATP synthase subunit B [Microscillaceae bacterium]
MNLVTPELGLIFWQLVVFITVLFILSRYAWAPITTALKDREKSITEALSKAEEAKKEMLKLQSDNQKLLDDARLERDNMLKSAQKVANDMIEQAKAKAEVEYAKKLEDARRAIDTEKQAAVTEIKKQIAELSIDVARTLLKRELENPDKQVQLAADLIKDLKVN